MPVPVWAMPITSRPARTTGIAPAWIGVGLRIAGIGDGLQHRLVETEVREAGEFKFSWDQGEVTDYTLSWRACM